MCLGIRGSYNEYIDPKMHMSYYENNKDEDSNLKILRKSLQLKDFLKIILNLRESEPLYQFLLESWKLNISKINLIKK